MNIENRAKELQQQIINWRRDLHRMPELENNLPKTSEYVRNELDKMNIEYKTYVNGSGIVATFGKNETGKVAALRSDMDGLPIKEQTGLPYSSQNENMHACGHDAHTAIGLGVAKLLKENENELSGMVKVIFQPGEETLVGAKAMISEGVLANPDVNYILALHTGAVPMLPNGSIASSFGTLTASSDAFIITVVGKSGHAGYPHQCINPVTITAKLVDAIQNIVGCEIDPAEPAVVSITGIKAGNDAFNAIPNECEIRGTYRTHNEKVRQYIENRLSEITNSITNAFHAECRVNIIKGVPSMKNDKNVLETVINTYNSMEDKKLVFTNPPAQMGGEDAACYFEKIPGAYVMFVTTKPVDGKIYPSHNSKYDVDDEYLYKASELMAKSLISLVNPS